MSSWTQFLTTMKTRKVNLHHYENYVTKHHPRKQTTALRVCENQPVGDVMVQKIRACPGILYGV